jgi:exopolysaccharide biosynthesis polyprenyl glycosylphosphotransferase
MALPGGVADNLRSRVALGVAERPDERLSPTGSWSLRARLLGLDALALALAWSLTALGMGTGGRALSQTAAAVILLTLGGMWLFRTFGLYRTSVCALRAVELTRLARACGVLAVATIATSRLTRVDVPIREAAIGAGGTLVLGAIFRGSYRSWLAGRRRAGEHRRPVLLVGTNDEAADVAALLGTHPEVGFRVVGVVGERIDAGSSGLARAWLGPIEDTIPVMHATGATGAIVCSTAFPSAQLNKVVHDLEEVGAHVQLSSGLSGVDVHRLRPMPLAYEPFFYIEPVSLERWQLATKRALDVVLATVGLLAAAPVLAVAAAGVRIFDRAPVIFRQTRIGRHGEPFTVYKLRTMHVGAEEQHDSLRDLNAREGPLFKVPADPRVTRLGRALRVTGIDELPQLWNVLTGTMTLVGPRPALPGEVAQFDEELRTREAVRPGLTGLWQVEARDNPSFDAYRRLDLFYLENWSVSLDLIILLATFEATVGRLFRAMREPGDDIVLAPVTSTEKHSAARWAGSDLSR